MKKMAKDVKNISREFATVDTQLQRLKEADSELYEFKDEYEASHFQMADTNFGKSEFQFAQLNNEFKPRITSIFNQNAGNKVGIQTKLDLS